MVIIGLCLQDWISSYPTGVVISDENGTTLDSEYADTKEDFIEFVRKHKDKLDEDTEIGISVKLGDVESTGVMDFAMEIVKEIKEIAEHEQT